MEGELREVGEEEGEVDRRHLVVEARLREGEGEGLLGLQKMWQLLSRAQRSLLSVAPLSGRDITVTSNNITCLEFQFRLCVPM